MLKQNFSEGQSSYHTLKSDVMWWGDMALLVGGARHLLRKLWCHQTLWKMTSRKKIFLSVNLGRSHWALRLFYFICFYFFFFVWMKSSVSAFFIFQDLWGNSEDRSQRVPLPGTGRGIAPQTQSGWSDVSSGRRAEAEGSHSEEEKALRQGQQRQSRTETIEPSVV